MNMQRIQEKMNASHLNEDAKKDFDIFLKTLGNDDKAYIEPYVDIIINEISAHFWIKSPFCHIRMSFLGDDNYHLLGMLHEYDIESVSNVVYGLPYSVLEAARNQALCRITDA